MTLEILEKYSDEYLKRFECIYKHNHPKEQGGRDWDIFMRYSGLTCRRESSKILTKEFSMSYNRISHISNKIINMFRMFCLEEMYAQMEREYRELKNKCTCNLTKTCID